MIEPPSLEHLQVQVLMNAWLSHICVDQQDRTVGHCCEGISQIDCGHGFAFATGCARKQDDLGVALALLADFHGQYSVLFGGNGIWGDRTDDESGSIFDTRNDRW